MERLRQLDQHYRIMMRTSDRFSTPFKRITRLFHTLVHKKVRTHVRINDKVIDANGMDKSKDGKWRKFHSFLNGNENERYYLKMYTQVFYKTIE